MSTSRANYEQVRRILAATAIIIITSFLSGPLFAQAVYLFDGFEDGNANGWQPHNASNWQVVKDGGDYSYFQINSNLSNQNQKLNEWSIYQNQTFSDMILSIKIKTAENLSPNSLTDYAVIFHYQDNDNYYFVFFSSSDNRTQLYKRQNGVETVLATAVNPTIIDNTYHTVAIKTFNGNITVLALEQTIMQVQDVTFLSGKIGLAVRNDATYFDNVFVAEYVISACNYWEDFNDDILDGWTAHDLSRWSTKYRDGDYDLWLNTTHYNSPGDKDLGEIITINDVVVSDFTFNCDIRSIENNSNANADLAFIFGYQDFQNYYYAILNRGVGNTSLRRLQNGVAYDIDVYNPSVLVDREWHHLKVTKSGGNVDVYFDHQLILSGFDNILLPGKIGVGSKNDAGHFDDICVDYEGGPPVSNLNLTFNQIDPAGFPVINCYVTVTDNVGNPIIGLTAQHFTVQENSTLQTPITVTPISGSQLPVSVALVIDRSGSMSGQPLVDAKTAANTFVDQLAANDKGAIISFANSATVDQGFTTNKNSIHNAINSLTSGGSTALFDAILEGVDQCNTQSGRKAIITLTDGGENASVHSDINHCISVAQAAAVPVFTIGLGIAPGSSDEQDLIRIATETGGRYYRAPTSLDLQQIYQLISLQLQNQYQITYTTSNPAYDCSMRNVEITVNYQQESDTKHRSYQAPCTPSVPIFPAAEAPTCTAGADVWITIQIGTASKPVEDLFAVSFVLGYTNTQYIDVISPTAASVIAGSFLGPDLVFFQDVNDAAGKVSVGVSRKSGVGGMDGFGTVVQIHLMVSNITPNNTQFIFSLSEVSAINPFGAPIQLEPQSFVLTVSSDIIVWPGDTTNDGVVNQADVLPLGVYFNMTGTARPGAPNNHWLAQTCPAAWSPPTATHADCDGNGIVNQADVFAIGLNWHRSHTTITALSNSIALEKTAQPAILKVVCSGDGLADNPRCARIEVENIQNLLGISFELMASNGEHIICDSLDYGDFLGDDLLAFHEINNAQHVVSVGETRKAPDGGVSGSGVLNQIFYHEKPQTPENTEIVFNLVNVSANDPSGQPIEIVVENTSTIVPVELAAFTAVVTTQGVLLQWSTLSETNNFGFSVERKLSSSGSTNWVEMGFVNGSGTIEHKFDYSFTDVDVTAGMRSYRLKQIDLNGTITYSKELSVAVTQNPKFELQQNFPNPFNPSTVIRYQLPEEADVSISIFNTLGQRVVLLVGKHQAAGSYIIKWDGTDASGVKVSPGLYFCKMETKGLNKTIKILYAK